ncbi:MAG: SpoIID/LytB domain-containing protein [Actinobacteria bacterium]|nr:SpoIID/LytB domain-containing protein [Actinomycetota bacterium]
MNYLTRATTFVATIAVLVGALPVMASAQPAPAGTVRFFGAPGTTFTVPGFGRFSGTIDLANAPGGGLTVVNELPMDDYIDGLGEMPASWPMEALKAQAVAARSYAWYSIELGTFRDRGLPYDICATVDCQVFDGLEVVESPDGHRWERAVDETAGEVLTWDGAPVMARFFSSAGGHTRNNEHVFGFGQRTAGPKPYLKGVEDPDEAISPHHRWSVQMTRAELEGLLSHGATLSQGLPMANIEWIASDGDPDGIRVDQVRVTRVDGHQVQLSASKFRAWLSEVGPQVLPNRFPVRNAEGKALPDTVPSSRFEFQLTATDALITGKGWGHGVGMSQWGARGKAEKGMTHDDILAAYYNGVRPDRTPHLPDRVRVGLADNAGAVTVQAHGPVTVVVGDQGGHSTSGGSWTVQAAAGQPTLGGTAVAFSPDALPQPPAPAEPPADAVVEPDARTLGQPEDPEQDADRIVEAPAPTMGPAAFFLRAASEAARLVLPVPTSLPDLFG